MSLVANLVVATKVNANFGARLTTSSKGQAKSDDFSKIFQDTRQIKKLDKKAFDTLYQERVVRRKKSTEELGENRKECTQIKQKEEPVDFNPKVKAYEEEAIQKDTQKDDEKIQGLDQVVESEQIDTIQEEMIHMISTIMGISVEELKEMMADFAMTTEDLMTTEDITKLVSKFFNMEDLGQLIMHEEAPEMIKQITHELEKMIQMMTTIEEDDQVVQTHPTVEKKYGWQANVDTEALIPVSLTQEEKSTEQLEKEPVQLEVNDLRSQQNTSEYNQSDKENQGSEFANLFAETMTVAKEVVMVKGAEQVLYQQVSTKDVIDQIVTKASINLSGDKTSMELQLNPEHLGKMAVSITAEQGVVKGHFVVENSLVREMIESNIALLKTQLEEQGIKVDKVEVTIGDANQFFDQNKENQQAFKQNKRKFNRINKLSDKMAIEEQLKDLSEDMIPVQSRLEKDMAEHTVSFSA